MKPHPRIRKTVKWGGTALTVLLVGVWVGSTRVRVQWDSPTFGRCGVFDGCLFMNATFEWEGRWPTGWFANEGGAIHWLPHVWWGYGLRVNLLELPLWIPAAIAAASSTAAWRFDTLARRRAAHNLCPTCRYSRTGLAPGAVCPECGSPPRPAAS